MASVIAKLRMKFSSRSQPLSIMIVGLDNSGKSSILNCLGSNHQSQPSSSNDIPDHKNSQVRLHDSSPSPWDETNIVPTIGYNYERIQIRNLTLTVLDFSGQNRYRNLWLEFCNGVDAIVFVIDSSDVIRLVVARDELETLLNHPYFLSLGCETNSISNTSGISSDVLVMHTTGIIDGSLTAQKQITINRGKLVQETINHQTNNNRPSKRRLKVPILFLANKSDLSSSISTEAIVKALNLNQLPTNRHPWFIQATSTTGSTQGIVEGFDWLVRQLSN